ncbi:hypothetical protein YM116_2340 [Enterococcus faecalis]|nr:hypothetical protein YM116_2340 [Enterococcus faecalis]
MREQKKTNELLQTIVSNQGDLDQKREVARTTPQDSDGNIYSVDEICIPNLN